MKKGFTLIELFVVVLIIGILAAVALPQYQKAVIKSRYAAMKQTVKSITNAQHLYYLTHGEYATTLKNLDVTLPTTGSSNTSFFAGGYCIANANYVFCYNSDIEMEYQVYLAGNRTECVVHATKFDINSYQSKLCQQETGKQTPDGSSDRYLIWIY